MLSARVPAPSARRGGVRVPSAGVQRAVWALLAVALILRAAVVAGTFDTPTTLDSADFSRNGLSIARGQGIPPSNRAPAGGPSAYRPPAYPAFLATVYFVAGEEAPPTARMVQALLGTVTVGLIGLIALRLWGRRIAMLALGIAAVAPPLVVMSTALISEALFVPLLLGTIACVLEARRSLRPLRWVIATGVLLGLAELTRTNAIVVLPALAAGVWTVAGGVRTPRGSVLHVATMAVVALLTIAPWTLRNWLALHAFVPVSTEAGYTLAGTYNLASRADRRWPAVWKEAEHGASSEYGQILFHASTQRWDERALGDHLLSAAIADIRHDPAYVLKVGAWNAVRLFHLGELQFAVANLRDTDIPRVPAWFEIYGFYPLGLLALLGLARGRVRHAPLWLWLVPTLLASSLLITGFIRFRAGIDPFLVLLAALGVAWLVDHLGGRAITTKHPPEERRPRARREASRILVSTRGTAYTCASRFA